MNDNIIKLINNSENVAILTHISEDADALGSAAAFAFAVRNFGKKADIYVSEKPEDRLSVIGESFIVYDGDDGKYDLCVCLDCGDMARLGERTKIFEAAEHTINIDHHYTNPKYAEENLVVGDASSTGEILYDLLTEMGAEITDDIARCIYIAIVGDTGCFKYSNTSPKTMRTAACLMEKSFDHADICRRLFDTERRGVMRFKGYVMENIHEYFGGRLCIAAADKNVFERCGLEEKETGDMVNIPRAVEGCEIAASIKDVGKIKLSFRSNGKYDVSGLAEKFGGGGHKMASGAALENGDTAEVEARIVSECKKLFEGV